MSHVAATIPELAVELRAEWEQAAVTQQTRNTFGRLYIGAASVKALPVDVEQRVVRRSFDPAQRFPPLSLVERAGPVGL